MSRLLFFALNILISAQIVVHAAPVRPEVSLLQRIDHASRTLNYSGLYVYQQGSSVNSTRITHMVDKGQSIEKLEILDGKIHEIIRVNDDITTYAPHSKTVTHHKRLQADQFPALFLGDNAEWQEVYTLKRGGDERIAGLDCEQISLEPKDGLRYGYRLWADKKSGLLVRAQTLNEKGELLDQTSFSEIKINLPFDRNKVQASWPSTVTHAWKQERVETQHAQWQQEGWQFKNLPSGFRKALEVRRPHLLQDAPSTPRVAQSMTGQVLFSDGLASASIFIEPYVEGQHQPDALRAVGATHMLAKRVADFWIVVVGDVPAETIRKLAAAVDYKPIK